MTDEREPGFMRYELTDLKVFLAVASKRSLSAAAESVHLSTPSASYRLKNLEQSLGCTLFERTSKGMVLTPAGLTVKIFAEKIMNTAGRLESEVVRHKIGTKGNIRLFANSSTLNRLMPILSTYLSRYPNVNIDLTEHLSEETVKAVQQGNADIGLVAGPVDTQGLESILYGEDELIFITPPHHPLSDQPQTSLANAVSYDLISVGRETSNFKYLENLAKNIGTSLRVRVHAPSFNSVIQCVRNGAGVALVPYSVAEPDILSGNVACVHIQEPWAVRPQQLVTKCAEDLPEYARHLMSSIVGDTTA